MAERKEAFFGPGGNSDSFRLQKKTTLDAPVWLAENGLDAYEYEAGRGFSSSTAALSLICQNAKRFVNGRIILTDHFGFRVDSR